MGHGKVVTYTAAAVLTALVITTIFWPYISVGLQTLLGLQPDGAKPTALYTGNLQINLNTYDNYDDSTNDPDNAVDLKIYHADESTVFGTATTLDGSDSITGQVFVEDKGILYLAIDHDTGTTEYYLETKTDSVNAYLTALSPRDVDDDGMLEYYFKLDVTSLTPLTAGETQKTITLNLYSMDSDVTGLNIVSITNPSSASLSGSSYVDLFAEAYVDGVTQGDGFKLVRVELTMPNAANETYVEDGKVKNVWVSIVGDSNTEYKWTTLSWQPGQDRYLVWEATDVTQEVYGKTVFYDRNMGATNVGRIKVHIQGANFAASAKWYPTIKLTFIDPAGTLSTDTLAISFTDT